MSVYRTIGPLVIYDAAHMKEVGLYVKFSTINMHYEMFLIMQSLTVV